MKYSPAIHHRRSIRLPDYNYAQPGAYFVTVCTYGRECTFSDARIADLVATVWRGVVAAFGPIDDFVVMPNHVHGIVWIGECGTPVGAQQHHRTPWGEHPLSPEANDLRPANGLVAAPLRQRRYAFTQRPVESGSLSAIVRTFKSATAKRINRLRGAHGAPLWQRNYYEHVVRDEDDLRRIREYIRDNPVRWNDDPLNPAVAARGAATGVDEIGRAVCL